MTKESAKEQASLQALKSQGEERVLRTADEASQRRLGEAIQATYMKEAQEKKKQDDLWAQGLLYFSAYIKLELNVEV